MVASNTVSMSRVDSFRLWRLVKKRHEYEAFDGEGACRYGGRWNSRGCRVIYASGSLALAVPSIVVPVEWNYLISPGHPDFRKLKIHEPRPFVLDPRVSVG